jgi:hypothetical protein
VQVKHDIHAPDGLERQLAHPLLHEIAGVEETGKVVEDVLGVALGAKSGHREPSGLGFGAHDREVSADQGVEEGGFPHVGGAGEGDVAGAGHRGR